MFTRWHGGRSGGVCAAVQRKDLREHSVQECEYHLGWSKSQALDRPDPFVVQMGKLRLREVT